MRSFLAFFFLFNATSVFAQFKHEPIRRITVFPLKVERTYLKEAEEAWWALREQLTESKRFLVASRNFMQAKDMFQPRGELKPADAIILGRLLDANALISTFVVNRTVSLRVYESLSGLTLWSGDIELHATLPIASQLKDSARKLLLDFISSIPYHGLLIVDSLVGRSTYSQGDRLFFKADVGVGSQATVGDEVQLIRVVPDKSHPVYQEGSTIEVYCEGQITQVDRQIITVQVTRRVPDVEITTGALLRIPDELRRVRESYGLYNDDQKYLGVELYRDENDSRLSEEEKKTKPLVTSLSWIGNLALVLLLAF